MGQWSDRWLTRDRTAVYPWFATVAMAGAWVISVGLGHGWTDAAHNVVGNDFLAFYSGAVMIAEDPAAPIYDRAATTVVQHEIVPAMDAQADIPFLNPPTALPWYRPLALLPFGAALFAWWGVGIAAWVAAHAALRGAVDELGAWSLGKMVLVSFLFVPTLTWVLYGQATGLAMLILCGSFALLMRGRDGAAGVVLGLLAFKPQLALGLALPMLFKGRWRGLIGGAVSVGAQLWLVRALWPSQFAAFWGVRHDIVAVVVDPSYKTWGVESAYGFWHLLIGGFSAPAADALTAGTGAIVVLAIGAAWWRVAWEPASPAWKLAMAATLTAAFPLGLQFYLYDAALLMLPFWIVVAAVRARPGTAPSLGGGPVLVWASILWTAAFLGPYLALVAGGLTARAGLPRVAVQILVPAMFGVSAWLWRRARVA